MNKSNYPTNKTNTDLITKKANIIPKRPPYKIELCITELLERGDAGLVELEAFQAYGETCLHSSISTLANKHNLEFTRVSHRHNSKRNVIVHFIRYSLLNEQQIDGAKALLLQYRSKRNVAA